MQTILSLLLAALLISVILGALLALLKAAGILIVGILALSVLLNRS